MQIRQQVLVRPWRLRLARQNDAAEQQVQVQDVQHLL
jgi:hypothetical protein